MPPIAIMSPACNFDWDMPFFTAAAERPVVIDGRIRRSGAACGGRGRVADVVLAGDTDVDMRRAVEALGDRGATTILAEGGPSLNGQLAAAGLLDELCLTLALSLAGGDAKRIVTGSPLAALEPLQLVSICERDDYLFLRYRPRTGS